MQILNIFHVLVAIAMVAFILVQRGPGATAGAAFGSGASGTVFGARGAGSFLSRSTWVMAALFCLISLSMAVWVSRNIGAPETDLGVVGTAPVTEQVDIVPVMEDTSSDLPAMDLEQITTGADLPAPDLPVPDSAAEEADAAAGGEDDSGR